MPTRFRIAPLALAAALALPGPALAGKNVDRVFGGITAEAGQEYGRLDTVNGSITVREGAIVRSAETVNGGIKIGRNARVGSAETVNGGIRIGEGAKVRSVETVNGGIRIDGGVEIERDVEAVNGSLELSDRARIGGDVENVNGRIELDNARVAGNLVTTSGDITLRKGSVIEGDLRVRRPQGWFSTSGKPVVTLEAGSEVKGALVLDREVELRVAPGAKHGPVRGEAAPAQLEKP